MMRLSELKQILKTNPDKMVEFVLPNGDTIPAHFHVTEVGHVRRDFIDCGRTTRSTASCLLQTWVATDEEHRITSTKLAAILELARRILPSDDLPVEVEYEGQVVSQYPITDGRAGPDTIVFLLGGKHTACLAPDKCGIPMADGTTVGCC